MRNDIHELILLLEQYLQNAMQTKGWLDCVVEYILPIVSMLVVIGGGIWTAWTYINGKRKESNEQVLKNVYLPLLCFFITNNTLSQIAGLKIDYKKEPLYEWESVEVIEKSDGTKREKRTAALGITRKNLSEQLDKVDLKLAPAELVALITSYRAACFAVDNFKDESNKKAIEYRTELEYALRFEAYNGYEKYHKKLGLQKGNKQRRLSIKKDHIELDLKHEK